MNKRQTISTNATRTFHHGNLRAALLHAAREKLEKDGHERLSLRELAENVGVTTGAPYRHFRSREALLCALADDGLNELGVVFERALQLKAEPEQRLREACRSYLEFAQQRPNLYRLIFVDNGHWVEEEIVSRGTLPSYEMFKRLVQEAAGSTLQTLGAVTTACWSLIHGFAVLRMSGRLAQEGNPRQLEHAVLDSVLRIAVSQAAVEPKFSSRQK